MENTLFYENLKELKNNKDILKSYFSKKGAVVTILSQDKYEFSFTDSLKNKDIYNITTVNFNENSIKFETRSDSVFNKYELDHYLTSTSSDLFAQFLSGQNKYTIRMYLQYTSLKPITQEVVFKFYNNFKISSFIKPETPYFHADTITSSPQEQILMVDLEVNAFDVTSARTIAYNKIKEFYSFLSVLLDLGIQEFASKRFFTLVDENPTSFICIDADKGFHDSELDLFVYDNLNGLIAFNEKNEMILNKNLSFTGSNNSTSVLCEYNDYLDKIFKNHKIKSKNNIVPVGKLNKNMNFYNSDISIVSECITFFRKLKEYREMESECDYNFVYNAAKLYNKALSTFENEPTMMISYLVASIEALSKVERKHDYYKKEQGDMNKFVAFCKEYSEPDMFDEDLLKYLYGDIRSAHFHAGEFKFFEYNLDLNQSLSNAFFEFRDNIYIKGHECLRGIFINWINSNLL